MRTKQDFGFFGGELCDPVYKLGERTSKEEKMKMWPKDRITDRKSPEVSESGLEHQERNCLLKLEECMMQ